MRQPEDFQVLKDTAWEQIHAMKAPRTDSREAHMQRAQTNKHTWALVQEHTDVVQTHCGVNTWALDLHPENHCPHPLF